MAIEMINLDKGIWKRLRHDSARKVNLSECPYDLKPLGNFDGNGNIILESGADVKVCHKCEKFFKIINTPKGYIAFVREEIATHKEIKRFRKEMTREEEILFLRKTIKEIERLKNDRR